ncbi:MAG: YfcE family phosphodiesterase [Acholeplasmatales bacterium]|nr:YfcE family phosphodiesterase [Acholeplasmatales bacterium]
MRILALSDSHFDKIKLDLNKYDYIIHCGDYGLSKKDLINNNVYFVKGNCDFSGEKELEVKINNKIIFITHGDKYNVKSTYNNLIYKALSINANICFFGHTHRPDMFVLDDIIYINPGAYLDGFYVVIDEEYIYFYKDKEIYKKFEFKW